MTTAGDNLLKRTGVLMATTNEDGKRTSNSYRWSDAIEEQEANEKQLSKIKQEQFSFPLDS